MKTIVTILMSCLLLTACKKEDDTRIVEGYIYKNCDKVPYVGMQLSINGTYYPPFEGPKNDYLGEITTDKNGYYKLVYQLEKRSGYTGISYVLKGHGEIIGTKYKDHINVTHYQYPTVKHKVILRVTDTLSLQDTLYLVALINRDPVLTLVGPFKDGQQSFITITPNIGINDFTQSDRVGKGLFWWGLGWEDVTHRSPDIYHDPQAITDVLQPVCGQGGDIVIDLRGK